MPTAIALVCIPIIGTVHYLVGAGVESHAIFLLPIVAASWYGGARAGLLAALFSAAVWFAADWLLVPPAELGLLALNEVMRLGVFIAVAIVVARLRAALARESALAQSDPLTGLANRRAFYELGTIEIARTRRYDRPITALFLDADGFKSVNDTFGHDAGDRLLIAVADVLRTHTRAADICARFGGDEFAVLLTLVLFHPSFLIRFHHRGRSTFSPRPMSTAPAEATRLDVAGKHAGVRAHPYLLVGEVGLDLRHRFGNTSMGKRIRTEQPARIGQRLADARKAAGFTEAELAAELCISQRRVAYYECPNATSPANLLPAIATALGASIDELFGRVPERRLAMQEGDSRLRLLAIETLDVAQTRQVLQLLDALIERGRLKHKTQAGAAR